jgi:hypothetical protein
MSYKVGHTDGQGDFCYWNNYLIKQDAEVVAKTFNEHDDGIHKQQTPDYYYCTRNTRTRRWIVIKEVAMEPE